jgi:pyruvate dehydrogenase E2 component (dihydrolipoamide acetyltransferase)
MTTRIQALTMPKWGIEMQEGTVNGWHAAIGETVARDAPLVDVETDKIVNTVESPYAGTLRRILANVGDVLPVGALLGVYAEPAVGEAEIDAFVAAFRPVDASHEPAAPLTEAPAAVAAAPAAPTDTESRVSPIARRLAERLGIDLAGIQGTGPNGRISKEDVEAAARRAAPPDATPAAPAVAANAPTRVPLSATRRTIARRLVESKQTIPHYRLGRDLDAGALVARVGALRAAGVRVSINDLVLRATGLALARHPTLNGHLVGDEFLCYADADIAVAVSTPDGLMTPVLRAVNRRALAELAAEARDLAARARAGDLRREDISGGTFTVSNLGMFGVERFDAIINPPQVAILAVGAVREVVVVRDGAPCVAHALAVTLSADHRVIDGAVGGAFLATLAELVAAPDALCAGGGRAAAPALRRCGRRTAGPSRRRRSRGSAVPGGGGSRCSCAPGTPPRRRSAPTPRRRCAARGGGSRRRRARRARSHG